MRRWIKVFELLFIAISVPACSLPLNGTSTPLPPANTASTPAVEPTGSSTEAPNVNHITVYFTDQTRFVTGTLPFEIAVKRALPAGADPMSSVLEAFFSGPTAEEAAQGLVLVSSGFTGIRKFTLQNGIAHVYMNGKCSNNGAAYSVAALIHKNLEQLPQINVIKIYDELGETNDPESSMDSIPYCLEP